MEIYKNGLPAEAFRRKNPLVLLIDEDISFVQKVSDCLPYDGFRVLRAETCDKALDILKRDRPQILLIDEEIAASSRFMDVARRLAVPYVVTSQDGCFDKGANALEAGADDYHEKSVSPRVLAAHLKAILRRPREKHNLRCIRIGDLEVDIDGRSAKRNGLNINLTASEFKIITQLGSIPGRVVAYEKLREISGLVDRGSLPAHIANLRKKLDRACQPSIIKTVRGIGYKLEVGNGNESRT